MGMAVGVRVSELLSLCSMHQEFGHTVMKNGMLRQQWDIHCIARVRQLMQRAVVLPSQGLER